MFVLLAALATAQDADKPPPMEFEQYAFVLLKKGPKWSDEDTAENRELMKGHLAHFDKMIEAKKMKVAGPFSEQEDDSLRGLCIYATSLDEARKLANADPRVAAGHLTVEVMTWWTQKDAVAFPKADGE